MDGKFISVVVLLVFVTFATAESPEQRPIPTPTKQNLTIGSDFTFECKDKDFPQIFFYVAMYMPTKSNVGKKACLRTRLNGCSPTDVILHQCGGREKTCKLKVALPEKAVECTGDYVLSLKWQCTIPLPAGNPKKVFNTLVEKDDPCAKYTTRQD